MLPTANHQCNTYCGIASVTLWKEGGILLNFAQKYKEDSKKYEGIQNFFIFFKFKILKLTFDNFGAAGWIVEVLTEF